MEGVSLFWNNKRGIVEHFFEIIIGIFIIVVLFTVGYRVINHLFCMHVVSSASTDITNIREAVNRAYNSAVGSVEEVDLNVPMSTKYCIRGGQIYVEGRCIAEGFDVDHLIVHNTFIQDEIRPHVNEMAVIIDEDSARDISTATICLTKGFYRLKFERTKSKVNLAYIYGTRDRG